MSDWAGILWLVVLLLGNAFFVGAEFAVMSARRSQIEPLAEAGSKRAQTTLRAMENVSLMLACAQLGITVCSLLILQVAEPAIHHLMAVPLEAVGVPVEIADVVAFAVALLLVTFLHVTIGEMVPKNISVSVADKAALLLAPPLMFIARLVKPVIVALNWSANHILKLMRIEPKDEVTSSFTLEEVQSIVQESTRHGLVDDDAGLITGCAGVLGTHRGRRDGAARQAGDDEVDTTPVEFEKAVSRTGFSRFPMLDDDGMLSGYLHIKDVLTIPDAAYHQPIAESQIRSLANLAMDDEIEKAMSVMQRTGSHLARVIGPDGLTQGVLFLEDVIELLVGEIRDATQATGYRRLGQAVAAGVSLNRNDSYLGIDSRQLLLLLILNNRSEVFPCTVPLPVSLPPGRRHPVADRLRPARGLRAGNRRCRRRHRRGGRLHQRLRGHRPHHRRRQGAGHLDHHADQPGPALLRGNHAGQAGGVQGRARGGKRRRLRRLHAQACRGRRAGQRQRAERRRALRAAPEEAPVRPPPPMPTDTDTPASTSTSGTACRPWPLADAVAAKLAALEPSSADTFNANAAAFKESLGGLDTKLAGIKASAGAAPVAVTEPVPLYLLEAAGLENQTPDEYTAAIEEDTDVPPAVLKATTDLMGSGSIRLLAYNQQTEGPQTVAVKDAAAAAGVPVVDFSETLPEGKSYLQWMTDNVDNIGKALARKRYSGPDSPADVGRPGRTDQPASQAGQPSPTAQPDRPARHPGAEREPEACAEFEDSQVDTRSEPPWSLPRVR